MRIVVQRVSRASVDVDGEAVGEISRGLLCLVGVRRGDGPVEAHLLAEKVAGLRVFGDANGQMNKSILEVGGAVLAVSQFTLYGDVRRGRRPSFTEAADPGTAAPLVEEFVRHLGLLGVRTASGRFGAMMEVSLINDGPVTLVVEALGGRLC